MKELIEYAEKEFDILEEDLPIEEIQSTSPLILPFADHDLAFDSVEKTVNINQIENDYNRNKFSYISSFVPIDKTKDSYILIFSTSRTVDMDGKILKIKWG